MTKFLLVTDLDNTLVGDDQALAELNQHLSQHRQVHGTKIVYATGRSLTSYQQLQTQQQLLDPDALVTSVGTEIYYNGSPNPDSTWSDLLAPQWNRDQIVATAADFADLVPQPNSEQRPFKVSYFLNEAAAADVLPQLESLLRDRGLNVKLIYSSAKDLDILPHQADKGAAMGFLRQGWEIEAQRAIACGDSGNDLALFQGREEWGVIVGNAQPELLSWHQTHPSTNRYLAKATCAGGILEGLKYFGFLA